MKPPVFIFLRGSAGKKGRRAAINVAVKNGVVELTGRITQARGPGITENTPAVTKVADHMVWVEPLSGMVIEPPAPAGSVLTQTRRNRN
jgi:hypothetical protein